MGTTPRGLHFSSSFATLALALALALASCDAPVKTLPPPRAEAPPAESASPAPPERQPEPEAPPVSAVHPQMQSPSPEPELEFTHPLLEVRQRGNRITVSGRLSSRHQASDLLEAIRREFPDSAVSDELLVDGGVEGVGWGNRARDLILPLLQLAEDAGFRYEHGVTRLEGTVESGRVKTTLHQMTANIMSDVDSVGIENELQAKE